MLEAVSYTHLYEVVGSRVASDYSTNPGRSRDTETQYYFGGVGYDEGPFGYYSGTAGGIGSSMNMGLGWSNSRAVSYTHLDVYKRQQLDSDDIYKDENTLQIVIDLFHKEKCAMVIGSYQITDFNLKELPPGLIDHKEWTNDNGPNNALRINGLGAPRAFYTPVLREIKIPNVSYGEDYSAGLAISRQYKICLLYTSRCV